jgi:threonine dehydrogenase-like Zn-dependent dehydrogenase
LIIVRKASSGMATMKSVQTGAPGAVAVVDLECPVPGPDDVLLRVRACGICGTDVTFLAVQKKSEVDLSAMLRSEMTLIASMGYPTEIFEVTPHLAEHWDRFAELISHRVPSTDVEHAFRLALTPGAAEKVIVTFDDHR